MSLEYPGVQKSSRVDDDIHMSASDVLYEMRWMDERVVISKKCWTGIDKKMPEISDEMNYMNWFRTEGGGKSWKIEKVGQR